MDWFFRPQKWHPFLYHEHNMSPMMKCLTRPRQIQSSLVDYSRVFPGPIVRKGGITFDLMIWRQHGIRPGGRSITKTGGKTSLSKLTSLTHALSRYREIGLRGEVSATRGGRQMSECELLIGKYDINAIRHSH